MNRFDINPIRSKTDDKKIIDNIKDLYEFINNKNNKHYHIVEINYLPIDYILDFKNFNYFTKRYIKEITFKNLNKNQEIILCELPSLQQVKILNSVVNLILDDGLESLISLKLKSNYNLDNTILSEIHDNFHYLEDITIFDIEISQSENNLTNFYLDKRYEYITNLSLENCEIEVEPYLYKNLRNISIYLKNIKNYTFNVNASFPKLEEFRGIMSSENITIDFNNNKLPSLEKFYLLILKCKTLIVNHVFTNLKDLTIHSLHLDILNLSFSFNHPKLKKANLVYPVKLPHNFVNVLSDEDVKKYENQIIIPKMPMKKSARNVF